MRECARWPEVKLVDRGKVVDSIIFHQLRQIVSNRQRREDALLYDNVMMYPYITEERWCCSGCKSVYVPAKLTPFTEVVAQHSWSGPRHTSMITSGVRGISTAPTSCAAAPTCFSLTVNRGGNKVGGIIREVGGRDRVHWRCITGVLHVWRACQTCVCLLKSVRMWVWYVVA